MRAVIQLVSKAEVTVEGEVTGSIGKGLCVLLGVEDRDDETDMDWLIRKILGMRIFSDGEKMNLDVNDVGGSILIISQFTLYGSTKKGNRPSFTRAAKPERARELYNLFINKFKAVSDVPLAFGSFGKHMELSLINDGPVTIVMDTKNKE